MPNNKRKPVEQAAGAQQTPSSSSAKSRVEELFDPKMQMKVDVTLDLPEHAEPSADGKTAKDAKDAVDAFLNSFGTEKLPQTCFPVARSKNNGQSAADFVLWDHVQRAAAKRLKDASERAEREGVFGDKDQYVEGETQMTFNSAEYSISIKKNAGSRVIDKELTEQVLREIAPHKWQELLDKCMKPRAGAAMRIVSLK